jgi:KaiC/GvpD/RAD55 family RecA-like ATPase
MLLRDMAHTRTGDKGRIVTISLFAYRDEDFALLEEKVTAEKVATYFGELIDRPVDRYVLPRISALNFVLHRPASQGVTRSLALDTHGKCLGYALLNMDISSSNPV